MDAVVYLARLLHVSWQGSHFGYPRILKYLFNVNDMALTFMGGHVSPMSADKLD